MDNVQILERDGVNVDLNTSLRFQYDLFGHTGYLSRCGSVDIATKAFEEEYCADFDAVLRFATKWNGKRNVFISLAPFAHKGTPAFIQCIGLDIDSKHPKDQAATEEEHQEALKVAAKIVEQMAQEAAIASSGNGAYVFWKLETPIVGDEEIKKHYEKVKAWIKDLQAQYPSVIIDPAIAHPKALFKCVGTQSTKGDINLRRYSQWDNADLSGRLRSSDSILQRFAGYSGSSPSTGETVIPNQPTYKSRSEADYALVAYIHERGFGPDVALQALRANPLGRQTDEKDQERLINKFYGREPQPSSNGGSGGVQPADFGEFIDCLRDSESQSGLTTGFTDFDKILGPIPKGELVGIAARSGFGKTTFALGITEHLRSLGKKVLYYSTEYKKRVILKQLAQIAMYIPKTQLEQPETITEATQHKLKAYQEDFGRNPVFIDDTDDPSLEQIDGAMVSVKPDIVLVDHLNWISQDYEVLAKLSKGLKILAKKHGITVVATAQMNEPAKNMKTGQEFNTTRADVRGCKDFINNSALFMYLTRPYVTETQLAPVDINVDKAHQNKKAYFTHRIWIDKEVSKFLELKE